ncbi:MAG: BCD family MFS transporter [Alphaproteobacteria bacterium]|jgi:BCD family chlorophyll transporter-like MFS transporter|nr:BCD family MFS transporter [Alphaproteobacteria bacterium]
MSDRMGDHAEQWRALLARLLPFADSATKDLPLSRLLRLSLFQVSAGMAAVLLTGALNRVMIVELGVPGWLVALMVSLPLVFAPLRALIGFRSDVHRSALGWKRGPFIWFGSMLQFGGLAIMPVSLLLLSGDSQAPAWVGHLAAGVAFLMVGAGMHTAQTAGLALATDLAADDARPRVVALLYVMLLVGMLISALVLGALLADFSAIRLIQVIQGAAVATMVLNVVALWKQEARVPNLTPRSAPRPKFAVEWRAFLQQGQVGRLLIATGFGAAAFSMQDVLLEPYGAQVLAMSVGATTGLTALWALGALGGFAWSARRLSKGAEPHRLAAMGGVIGIAAFSAVILSGMATDLALFCCGVFGIGLGGAVFSTGVLTAAMALARSGQSGIALGAWGGVQATSAGIAIALAGALRDWMAQAGAAGALGPAFVQPVSAYAMVYHIEIGLLFAMLVAIGPLARFDADIHRAIPTTKFGLSEFPT